MPISLQPLIESIQAVVASHALGQPGAYRRWNWQHTNGARDLGLNAYGCADAANLLYTINAFPADPAERAEWVETLRGLQDAGSGMFNEATHVPIHTTVHCIAALPAHPLRALVELRDPTALARLFGWAERPAQPVWGKLLPGGAAIRPTRRAAQR